MIKLPRCAAVIFVGLLASCEAAFAQQVVLQGGSTTSGHAPMYLVYGTQPYVMDSGTAAGGGVGVGMTELLLAERGITTPPFSNAGNGPLYTNLCDYDGPTTSSAGYHYLCFGPNAGGGGLIAYGYSGSAGPLSLAFNVNGSTPLTLAAGGATISTPAITGGTISGSAITGGTITSSAITATNASLTTPTITGGAISGASISATGSVLTTPAITGGTITGGTITGGSISGATISQALTNTHLFVGNGSNIATDVALSGDAAITNTGSVTVSKTGGVPFGTAANVNTGTSGATIPLLNGTNTWSGNQTLTAVSFTSTGAMALNVFVVTSGASYSAAATDYAIVVNKASGSATVVNLPGTPATGRVIVIKDGKGDAQTNNITVAGNIDGAASLLLRTAYASVMLIYNGTQWNSL